jgi:hypothetical protein
MSKDSKQDYKGNGAHKWEKVWANEASFTYRLRVPGGWIYRFALKRPERYHQSMVFVPMPEVVKHKV